MKRILSLVSISLIGVLLASCNNSTNSSAPISGYHQASVDSYRISSHVSLDIYRQNGMPSTGEVKILVIPVCFSGENDPDFTDEERRKLEKAYFGDSSSTSWESLSSFYKKSSYRKLNISGTITGAYKHPLTSAEMTEKNNNNEDVVATLLESSVNYVTASLGIKATDYDANKDGLIDVVELIYVTGEPLQSQGGSSLWWAFTKSATTIATVVDKTKTIPSRYFWAPYSMICPGSYGGDSIDTHVLIHETGHAMGLNDYYSYAAGDNAVCPSGGIDMMDFNVGDHDAYSKMALGWVDPFVVDGSEETFSLTLHSFTDTGECVILRDTKTDPWNGMPYDEYLLLQYYTPTGLNEKDSTGYPEWDGKLGHGGTYETYGLQLFHIDSRLFQITTTADDPLGAKGYTLSYSDTLSDKQTTDPDTGNLVTASYIAASNTINYSYNVEEDKLGSPNCLISIIPASKTTSFMSKYYKSSVGLMSNLFGVGDKYGSDTFSMNKYSQNMTNGAKFNDGSTLDYSFTIKSNDASSCSLVFSSAS